MSFRNPLKQAKGLGSAHAGLHHWVVQRYTAVALIFLGLWFVYFVVGLIHADYLAATDAIARPWNATLLVAFLVAMFWHAQLGLQVILEDYLIGHSQFFNAVRLSFGVRAQPCRRSSFIAAHFHIQ